MSSLFEKLKQKQESVSDVTTLVDSLNKMERKFETDDRFWKPQTDETGIGQAIIRFLPNPDPDKESCVLYYNHSFKNPISGKWFIEKCPTSIGRTDCPVNYTYAA